MSTTFDEPPEERPEPAPRKSLGRRAVRFFGYSMPETHGRTDWEDVSDFVDEDGFFRD